MNVVHKSRFPLDFNPELLCHIMRVSEASSVLDTYADLLFQSDGLHAQYDRFCHDQMQSRCQWMDLSIIYLGISPVL